MYSFCVAAPRSPFHSCRLYRSKCLPLTRKIHHPRVKFEPRCTLPGQRRTTDLAAAIANKRNTYRQSSFGLYDRFNNNGARMHVFPNAFAVRNSKGKTWGRPLPREVIPQRFRGPFSRGGAATGVYIDRTGAMGSTRHQTLPRP